MGIPRAAGHFAWVPPENCFRWNIFSSRAAQEAEPSKLFHVEQFTAGNLTEQNCSTWNIFNEAQRYGSDQIVSRETISGRAKNFRF